MTGRAWFFLALLAPPLWGILFLVSLALVLAWLNFGRGW